MKKIPQLRLTCALAEDRQKTLDVDVFSVIGTDWDGDESSAAAARRAIKNADVDLIRLSINSPGGFTDDATAIYQMLADHPAKVEVMVYNAASSATLIALAGDSIRMAELGQWMIHEATVCTCGNADWLTKAAARCDKVSAQFAELYAKRTSKSADEMRAMMKAETWLTAAEAFDLGFVDEVVSGKEGELKIAACFVPEALEQFANVPKRIAAIHQPRPAQQVLPLPTEGSAKNTQPVKELHEMKTIASALGLSADATEAQIVQAINASNVERSRAEADLGRVLAATETKTVDEALGAIVALQNTRSELDKATAKIEEQERAAAESRRAQVIAKLEAENRITPAQKAGFCATATLETLEAFAKDAPVIKTKSEHQEPGVAAPVGGVPTGKTWSQMTNMERDALYRADRDEYDRRKAEAQH